MARCLTDWEHLGSDTAGEGMDSLSLTSHFKKDAESTSVTVLCYARLILFMCLALLTCNVNGLLYQNNELGGHCEWVRQK
jgi:hypothetical protein